MDEPVANSVAATPIPAAATHDEEIEKNGLPFNWIAKRHVRHRSSVVYYEGPDNKKAKSRHEAWALHARSLEGEAAAATTNAWIPSAEQANSSSPLAYAYEMTSHLVGEDELLNAALNIGSRN